MVSLIYRCYNSNINKKHDYFCTFLLMLSMLLVELILLFPCTAQAIQAPYIDIYESFDGSKINFTIDTTYNNVISFAVGNNNGTGAGFGSTYDGPVGWNAALATYELDRWSINSSVPEIAKVTLGLSQFSVNYKSAFFYWSSDDSGTKFGTPLNRGLTNGFEGYTTAICSPFVAFLGDTNNGIGEVTLNRNTSTVPIPSSVWLFGSGLVGLISLKRLRS